MKIRLLLAILLVLVCTGSLFALDRGRRIVPITDANPVLTKSLYNATMNMDPASRRLVYISYVAGFVDAMQLNSMDNASAKKFLDDDQGLTLGDLIDMSISFKDKYEQYRDVPPAIVMTEVIPRLRKGLSPFPDNKYDIQVKK
jgi:hypothetical protein